MTTQPIIIRTKQALRAQTLLWKKQGLKVGLVPTMGALHDGHLSLVDHLAGHCDRIITSIFVNPTQFGESEDLDAYPRQEEADIAKLSNHPCDAVYIPSVDQIYTANFATNISVSGISDAFEGKLRPGHFDGVATVVTKLLLQSQADVAIFGEKDFQQLAVIRRFVADLDIPVEIFAGPIVRENDGLAMSSRNSYLSASERTIAGHFNKILEKLVVSVEKGESIKTAEDSAKQSLLAAGFNRVDYVTVVDPATLQPATETKKPTQVLAVARIGSVRLLDNMAIKAT